MFKLLQIVAFFCSLVPATTMAGNRQEDCSVGWKSAEEAVWQLINTSEFKRMQHAFCPAAVQFGKSLVVCRSSPGRFYEFGEVLDLLRDGDCGKVAGLRDRALVVAKEEIGKGKDGWWDHSCRVNGSTDSCAGIGGIHEHFTWQEMGLPEDYWCMVNPYAFLSNKRPAYCQQKLDAKGPPR